jgi:hypothetical protein
MVTRTFLIVATVFLQLAWLLSLPTLVLMWTGHPVACIALWVVVGRLGYRAFLTGVVTSHHTVKTVVASPRV